MSLFRHFHIIALSLAVGLGAIPVFACDAQGRSAGSYFEGQVEPCAATSTDVEPCAVRRDVLFQGGSDGSMILPDQPPSLERLLFNAWGDQNLDEVPNIDLVSATHIVARGQIPDDALVCQGNPLLFPPWSYDLTDFEIPDLEEGEVIQLDLSPTVEEAGSESQELAELPEIDFGIYHWMCFARLHVHEYMVGKGGASITVNLPTASVPYFDASEPDASEIKELLEQHRMRVAEHFVGREWVVWLAPSYTTAVESWTAYSLWEVQRGEDGIVRVVSDAAEYYENMEDSEYDHSHLMAPLGEFREQIAAADSARRARTSGRIGVGEDTPMLVQDAFRLSDYYREIRAYNNPVLTPAPAPNP